MKIKAFTLVELLVVMMVIAILVGVAIPRMKGMQDEANQRKAEVELRTLQAAVESYYINQSPRAYPDTTTTICATYLNSAKPTIVGDVLTDPFRPGSQEYRYIKSDNGNYYVLFSYGINGAANISGINDSGYLQGSNVDDIYVTNGLGW